MMFFFLLAGISFVLMLGIILPKLRVVRAEEAAHNEHVGIVQVTRPLVLKAQEKFSVIRAWAWRHVGPHAKRVLFQLGTWLHQISVSLAKKLLDLAALMRGKGVVKKRPDAPQGWISEVAVRRTSSQN